MYEKPGENGKGWTLFYVYAPDHMYIASPKLALTSFAVYLPFPSSKQSETLGVTFHFKGEQPLISEVPVVT